MKLVREIAVPIKWNPETQEWDAALLDNGMFEGSTSSPLPDAILGWAGAAMDKVIDDNGDKRYTLLLQVYDPTPEPKPTQVK